MFETKTRMIKIISMVMMSCRMMLLLKTSPEADDGGLGGGGDDMRAADRFFLPPLPTGTTAKYLQIYIFIKPARFCALRALGLLLADGTPTVGGGKTF